MVNFLNIGPRMHMAITVQLASMKVGSTVLANARTSPSTENSAPEISGYFVLSPVFHTLTIAVLPIVDKKGLTRAKKILIVLKAGISLETWFENPSPQLLRIRSSNEISLLGG